MINDMPGLVSFLHHMGVDKWEFNRLPGIAAGAKLYLYDVDNDLADHIQEEISKRIPAWDRVEVVLVT